jgi:hypothetical protein
MPLFQDATQYNLAAVTCDRRGAFAPASFADHGAVGRLLRGTMGTSMEACPQSPNPFRPDCETDGDVSVVASTTLG